MQTVIPRSTPWTIRLILCPRKFLSFDDSWREWVRESIHCILYNAERSAGGELRRLPRYCRTLFLSTARFVYLPKPQLCHYIWFFITLTILVIQVSINVWTWSCQVVSGLLRIIGNGLNHCIFWFLATLYWAISTLNPIAVARIDDISSFGFTNAHNSVKV